MNSNLQIIPTEGMPESQFKEIRKSGLGGTDIAAIFRMSPWKTPIQVWQEKTGKSDPVSETVLMRRGRDMEALVAGWYRDRTGLHVLPGGIVINPDTAPVFGSVDRFVSKNGDGPDRGLEVKTATIRNRDQAAKWGEDGSDVIPDNYRTQVLTYLLVTGLPVFDLAALLALDDLRVYQILPDKESLSAILEGARDWWNRYVVTDTPPPVDGTSEYSEYLSEAFSVPRDKSIIAVNDPTVMEAVDRLATLKRAIAEYEAQKALVENIIKSAIGPYFGVEVAGQKITWGPVDRNVVDYKGLLKHLGVPDSKIAEFTTTETSRRFVTPREWTKNA